MRLSASCNSDSSFWYFTVLPLQGKGRDAENLSLRFPPSFGRRRGGAIFISSPSLHRLALEQFISWLWKGSL